MLGGMDNENLRIEARLIAAEAVLAAVVMGVFLWISHRPGRYVGG